MKWYRNYASIATGRRLKELIHVFLFLKIKNQMTNENIE